MSKRKTKSTFVDMSDNGAGRPAPSREFITNHRPYKGFSLQDVVFRPRALDMLKHPSKYGTLSQYPNTSKGE